MNDAISREMVLNTEYQIKKINGIEYVMLSEVQMKIRKMSPVTPQQKSGKWIHFAQSDDCSLCGYSTGKYGSPSKYCPNCGTRMESDDKE